VIRRLFWIAAAALLFWLVRKLGQARRRPAGARADAPRFEGAMVRDRVCQTFVPRARALSVRAGDGEHFFCSAACRDAFLARSGALTP
jgi:YHS domain-containing protein